MKITLLNRLLNVSDKEWSRITLSWCLHLFLRMGFVMGWTITIAMFISRMGIEFLPYLFVLNALLVMMGTLIYSNFLKQTSHAALILYTTLAAGALLLFGSFFSYSNNVLFFGSILVAQSILLTQLNILIALFTEDLFTPLESERTFPLIASAETIGGVIGGLMVGLLSGFLPSYKFIYLWMLSLFLIIPTILIAHNHSKKLPIIKIQRKNHQHKRSKRGLENIAEGLKAMKKAPFLQGLVVVVMLQFMLLNLFEYQYTKAVQESVVEHHQSSISLEMNNYQPETNLHVSLLNIEQVETETEVMGHSTLSVENELSKNLGILQVIFSLGSLLVQIFVASRIIRSLGIVGSLIIHPLATFLHVVGMIIQFNFFTAAVGRSGFEITGSIFKNAYHSSYYAISEEQRDQIKEVIEGVAKPFGAVLAFIGLLMIQNISSSQQETIIINLTMLTVTGLMTLRLMRLQNQYTRLSGRNLRKHNDLSTRLNAIEILSQNGHKSSLKNLIHYLKDDDETLQVKHKIIHTLKGKHNDEILSDLIQSLENNPKEIRIGILELLNTFDGLSTSLASKAFTKYQMLTSLKRLFEEDDSASIKALCVRLLAKIDPDHLVPFLSQKMESDEPHVKRACISAFAQFKDPYIIDYIQGYLDDRDPELRAETIHALWDFKKLRKTLCQHVEEMKKSKDKATTLATLNLLKHRGNKHDLPYLLKKVNQKDSDIHQAAVMALGSLHQNEAIPYLVEFAFHNDPNVAQKTHKFIQDKSHPFNETIEQLVHLKISEYINQILNKTGAESLNELDDSTLLTLKSAYATVDEYDEVTKIDHILAKRSEIKSTSFKKAHVPSS